ncbi:MAG: hypothetical protein JSW29_05985 [Candidatus Bathyarchaeota archaeon]|nr:MAG: hypothetical protein JSW29_05985 [Candidatus Bathyarchaeota archaeon]
MVVEVCTSASLLGYFLIANFAPQAEHLPSAVIFGFSGSSAPHNPHFAIGIHLRELIYCCNFLFERAFKSM